MSLAERNLSTCALCRLKVVKKPLISGEKAFCCAGCLTVFNILQTREVSENYREHPLFLHAVESGVISNPYLLEEIEQERTFETVEKIHFQIDHMWCVSCAEAIRLILLRQKGIKSCFVDYATDLASIEYSPRHLSKEQIFSLIERLGYLPSELLSEERKPRKLWLQFAVAAFCAGNIMMLSYPLYVSSFGMHTEGYGLVLGWLSFALSLPIITYAALPIWRAFLTSVRSGLLGMEALVLIGVSSAFFVSTLSLLQKRAETLYFDSMSMILVFVLLGKILERKAKFSAKETLYRLTRSLPQKGRRRTSDGSVETVALKEIHLDDVLVATTGEKIVLDGVVEKGEAICDESVMTGESLPVLKMAGKKVTGGSIVKGGSVDYRVTATAETSLLSRIFEMVEQRIGKKPLSMRLVDRWIPFFVPVVLLLALLTTLLSHDLMRGISVLLISCPCAIGIAAPLAEALLLHRLAERGALVRNRAILPLLAKHPLYVFDKTGTLTEGKFQLLRGCEKLTHLEKRILKSLALASSHPLSVAVAEALKESPVQLDSVQEITGQGMLGYFQGKAYRLGSARLLNVSIEPSAKGDLVTTVYFAEEKSVLAPLELGDRMRLFSIPNDSWLLSGDHEGVVAAVAQAYGITNWKSTCDPFEKKEEIEKLKRSGRPVVMVGDGINDAPALAAADIGISVVSGTEMAIQVSDLLLSRDQLSNLKEIESLARKGRRIIYQNLFWAFFYNTIGIVLAMGGLLTPLFAAGAMVLSSLFVSLNALRH